MTFRRIASCLLTALVLAATGCARDRAPAERAAEGPAPGPDQAAPGHDHAALGHAAPAPADAAALCAGHAVPAALCFLCDPARREAGRLWCNEHARYEDRCWLCHPELRDASRLYCEEHGLYEDECFYCHPDVLAPGAAPARSDARAPAADLPCAEHRVMEAECGICHPELAAGMAPGQGLKVRLASPEAAAKAGMTVARPQEGELDLGIACYAEIVFDQNRLARISPPTDGITRSVRVDLGDRVAPGEVLATMSSAAIGDAVSRAVLAHQTVERERALRAQRVSSEKDLQVAEASYRASQQELRTMGFDEGQIRDFVSHSTDLDALELRAPFAGEIVERSAVLGEMVEAGTALFTIADRSTMWAMLSLPERDLSRARVGQTVEIRVDAIPHRHFSGRLAWISARVDDRTRMTQARAEIADPERLLSDRMFATARILTGRSAPGMLVPASALHHIDDRDFVFVKLEEDLYEARRVDVGGAADGLVAVARGLGPDEAVVVEGGFLARSQFLISKLGAGCAD